LGFAIRLGIELSGTDDAREVVRVRVGVRDRAGN